MSDSRYHEGFVDGYEYALYEIFTKISEIEGLDPYTIETISDMIEYNKI
jgi:hypothetical protein